MKIAVDYLIRVKKDVEVTPEEYCQLHADCHSRPDIFPENAFDCNMSYDINGMKELQAFYEKKQAN